MPNSRKLTKGILTASAAFMCLYTAAYAAPDASSGQVVPVKDDRIHLPYTRIYPIQPPTPKREYRERLLLKKDDDSMESPSILSASHAMTFTKPSGSWVISGVVLYLGRVGHSEPEEGFKVYVCDSERRPLTSVWRPKSRVRLGNPQWYFFDFPPTEIPPEFCVMVDLRRSADDRSIVYLGSDNSEPTAKPQIAEPNGPSTYNLEQVGTWMIRAVLSGDGNRPEDIVDAQIIPDRDQILGMPPKEGLKAYRSAGRNLKWVSQIPKISSKVGRLELGWDQRDAIIGVRYLGKRGSIMKVVSKSLTIDIPVTAPSVFEVSIMRQGFLPAVKRFTVTPGTSESWKVELKAKQSEDTAI